MIEIITTVESFEQAKELIEAGTDTLYFWRRGYLA